MSEAAEYPPAKKLKLDAPFNTIVDTNEEVIDGDEGWDEIYGYPEDKGKQTQTGGSQRDIPGNEADSSVAAQQNDTADSGANHEAEYEFGSSDSDSSDDSSSDDDSDGDYPLLDPETAAKMLMAGDGDDDDAGDKNGKTPGDYQPRTANEVKEEIAPRPEILITPGMQITPLGKIESIVENTILVKGYNSGEYQVLEAGSVLCTRARAVVGIVADTFGKVQEPFYSVLFDTTQEELLQELQLAPGLELYYSDQHTSFVFTDPLLGLKGTDASNLHDEEAGDDEIEFSDDEKEAEYKRVKKLAKKTGRPVLTREAFVERGRPAARARGPTRASTLPTDHGSKPSGLPRGAYEGGGLNYDDSAIDDGSTNDGPYQKLSRPDNFTELLAAGSRGGNARGRGRGHVERGRSRGGRRGGTGRRAPQGQTSPASNSHASGLPVSWFQPAQAPQPPQAPQYEQAQAPQPYQSNGHDAQYAQPNYSSPAFSYYGMQPGAYVNPAFYAGHQYQQQEGSSSAPQGAYQYQSAYYSQQPGYPQYQPQQYQQGHQQGAWTAPSDVYQQPQPYQQGQQQGAWTAPPNASPQPQQFWTAPPDATPQPQQYQQIYQQGAWTAPPDTSLQQSAPVTSGPTQYNFPPLRTIPADTTMSGLQQMEVRQVRRELDREPQP